MGNKIIFAIDTVISLGIGAVGAWYFTKRYCDKKKDEELSAYKDYYDKKIAGLELRIKNLEMGPVTITVGSDKSPDESKSDDKEGDRRDKEVSSSDANSEAGQVKE